MIFSSLSEVCILSTPLFDLPIPLLNPYQTGDKQATKFYLINLTVQGVNDAKLKNVF